MPQRRATKGPRAWSYSGGERGTNRVRVYERPERGDVLLEWYDQAGGSRKRQRESLGAVSREAAMVQAERTATALRHMTPRPRTDPVTVGELFDKYEASVTPTKGRTSQLHDRTCAKLWTRSLGAKRAVATLGRLEWDRFIADRRSGALRPDRQRGVGVRDRQVQQDCKFVLAACNWALTVTDEHGRPMLDRNPFRGLKVPREESPHRPELTDAEYQALLGASGTVHPQFRAALIVTHETGHRISSVRSLQWSDVDLKAKTVHWRAESDKMGFESTTFLSDVAVRALELYRSRVMAIGDVWIFPAQRGELGPTSRNTLSRWFREVEREAKLPAVKGRGWHSLRRKFATEMKHAPLKDLAYLGGWKSVATVVDIYQRPDAVTMQRALAARRPVEQVDSGDGPIDTTNRHHAVGR